MKKMRSPLYSVVLTLIIGLTANTGAVFADIEGSSKDQTNHPGTVEPQDLNSPMPK